MEAGGGGGGGRTFKVNFSGDGVSKLRERIKEKLLEFMGDYTDDTLAEYVIVLLRNGRSRDEAVKELQVFLGDDNEAFTLWLWEHLSSNLHLYVAPPKAPPSNDEAKSNRIAREALLRENKLSREQLVGGSRANAEPEGETTRTSKSRQRREWGGVIRNESEPVALRSVIADVLNVEEKTRQKSRPASRSRSPQMHDNRKRSRDEDGQQRIPLSQPVIDAPRRLLQFAVRDAVRTVQQPTPRLEPASKRLRSVLSTSTSELVQDVKLYRTNSELRTSATTSAKSDIIQDARLYRTNSEVRAPRAAATALRAAAEAARDVTKGRMSGSVFGRLSRQRSEMYTTRVEHDREVEDYEDIDIVPARIGEEYRQRNQFAGDVNMFNRETEEVDSASDNDGYGSVRHHGLDAPRNILSSMKDRESVMVGYNIAQGPATIRKTRMMDEDSPSGSVPRTSGKILNISVNVNTWKPPNFEVTRNLGNVETPMAMDKRDVSSMKPNLRITNADDPPIANKAKGLANAGSQVEQKQDLPAAVASGSFATGQPLGDVDSRTVFVSNVHFGATKDALSRHFNKFGAVLKVIILTDGSTGQPTGSAYIEFLHKESAEQALSLSGSSFMSRILKVVRRSSPEVPQLSGWPRATLGSPYASRLIRTAYPRPHPGVIRGRLPLKTGARSLQWKRDAASSPTAEAGKSTPSAQVAAGNQLVSPTARSFTYTRTETKATAGPTT